MKWATVVWWVVGRSRGEEVVEWLEANGGLARGVEMGMFEARAGGRGLRCTRSIEAKEQVLRVPVSVMMTGDAARAQYPAYRHTLSRDEDAIATMLAAERAKGRRSRWAPYVASLPKAVPSLKTMRDEELELLQQPWLKERGQRARSRVREAAERLAPTLNATLVSALRLGEGEEEKDDSGGVVGWTEDDLFESYAWARSIIDSRALTFRGARMLAPVADMVNYAPQPGAESRESDGGAFFLEYHRVGDDALETLADRPCEAGQQFLEDYGDNSNLVYLEHHGFVPESNPFDCAKIELPPLDADGLLDARIQLLKQLGERGPPYPCLRRDDLARAASVSLRRYLWACSISDRKILDECATVFQRNSGESPSCPRDPSLSHVLPLLCAEIDAALHAYPTSLRADDELLHRVVNNGGITIEGVEATPGAVLALRYRRAQKQVLGALQADCARLLVGAASGQAAELTSSKSSKFSSSRDLERRVADFNDWCRAQAWPVLKIRADVLPSHGGRLAAVATEAVRKGEAYVEVPESACLDAAAARDALGDAVAGLDDYHATLFYLLYELTQLIRDHPPQEGVEKNNKVDASKSRFGPYLLLLPGVDATLDVLRGAGDPQNISEDTAQCRGEIEGPPLFWGNDEAETAELAKKFLAGSDLEAAVVSYASSVRRKWASTSQTFRASPRLRSMFQDTVDETVLDWRVYRWASQILDSRSIWWSGHRHLVPMLDLVNAAAADELPPNAPVHRTIPDAETGKNAVTVAAASFAAGDQVLEDYGQPNHVLFLYHGFVLPVNKHDCVRFDLVVPYKDDPAYLENVRRRLRAHRFASPTYVACLKPGISPDDRVFAFLAVKHDLEPPNPRAGPSLQLLLVLADEIHDRLNNRPDHLDHHANPTTAPTTDKGHLAASILLAAERRLLTDLYDELTDQARRHEAFVDLRR